MELFIASVDIREFKAEYDLFRDESPLTNWTECHSYEWAGLIRLLEAGNPDFKT